MERIKITEDRFDEELLNLKEWKIVDGKINRTFKFSNFVEAFSFMTKVALEAEKIDHHPEWSNTYNNVDIKLSTHDLKGISTFDFYLAKRIDECYRK